MSTVALVLHDPAASRVRALWKVLEDRLNLAGVRKVPFPHVTLLGFDDLTHPQVKDLLERLSQATAPFQLEACGLGFFNDPAPILYAPVVQTPALHLLHRALHGQLLDLGGKVYDLYTPGRWVPHITLAQGPGAPGAYGEAVELLMKEPLRMSFEVRNLTLFEWIGPRYEPCDRFPLMG